MVQKRYPYHVYKLEEPEVESEEEKDSPYSGFWVTSIRMKERDLAALDASSKDLISQHILILNCVSNTFKKVEALIQIQSQGHAFETGNTT
jgi:hypothetical protein